MTTYILIILLVVSSILASYMLVKIGTVEIGWMILQQLLFFIVPLVCITDPQIDYLEVRVLL
jgi:hypothetical protein